ncbi:MAG: hypothetical protein R3D28_09685 [Geminicoccaceae bacterium]
MRCSRPRWASGWPGDRRLRPGEHRKAAALIRPVRGIAHRFGGSHAQRDVIDLTLIEAALRSGEEALARGLIAERAARRHESPLTRLFMARSRVAALASRAGPRGDPRPRCPA